jgi:hypothetical protein
MISSGRIFPVEYETIGESTGPSRVVRTTAVVDMEGIALERTGKLRVGRRMAVRIDDGGDAGSFVGVAVAERSKHGVVWARWHLLDADRVQLEAILEAREKAEEAA